jgi:hypothetical protein
MQPNVAQSINLQVTSYNGTAYNSYLPLLRMNIQAIISEAIVAIVTINRQTQAIIKSRLIRRIT